MVTLNQSNRFTKNLLRTIGRRAERDNEIDFEMLRVERNRAVTSHQVKCVHLARMQPGVSFETVQMQAARIDLLEPFAGSLRYFETPRLGRSPRLICNPPQQIKLAGRVAKALIEAQFEPGAHIYNWPGRGSGRLLRDLTRCLGDGPEHIILADIRDCYESMDFDAIYALDILPNAFVEANLDVRRMNMVRTACQHIVDGNAKGGICSMCSYIGNNTVPMVRHGRNRGIMQGSAASNAFLAMLLDDLPSQMPDGVTVFAFSDNIAVVCPTEEVRRSAEDALGRYFSNHRAGPLSLQVDFAGWAKMGFEHLGYAVDWRDGRWMIHHSARNHFRAMERLLATLEDGSVEGFDDAFEAVRAGFPALDVAAMSKLVDQVEWELAFEGGRSSEAVGSCSNMP